MLSIIVAKAKNNIIGKDNKLIWHISDDLRRFKNLTQNHTIIMGRKTFEALGRVLPNRKHVVITHNKNFIINDENVKIVQDIIDLKEYINSNEEYFVIGGANIYKLLLPYTEKMYITEIDENFEGDTVFPKIKEDDWEEVERIEGPKDNENRFKYEYVTYVRKDYKNK